tara:strand:- start:828 stop:1835 length:1008 start_codon:yes stop_codon:yes gene_type:complete
MKSRLRATLVNDPFGDPGLLVQFLFQKRSLLFDLGDISPLSSGELLKVSHVFVSHTHMDHFIGFDRLLRTVFGHQKTITLFGPENFIKNVEGKLNGFTWNLVDRYENSLTLKVVEVREKKLLQATFKAIDKFKKMYEEEVEFKNGLIMDDPLFTVNAAVLEHRVPCLGFSLQEKIHVNINKERLKVMQIVKGPWLNELKQSVLKGKPDTHVIDVPFKEKGESRLKQTTLEELKENLLDISSGEKIGYVVDTIYNEQNKRKIIDLVHSADIFFCESPFLADETTRGFERYHLTSRQAGTIAREAGVKKLNVFHFSGRHKLRPDQIIQEAGEAFRGE